MAGVYKIKSEQCTFTLSSLLHYSLNFENISTIAKVVQEGFLFFFSFLVQQYETPI